MDMKFLIVQFIGLLAGLFLIFSYYRKDTNKVLAFHTVSGMLDFIHYLLLGAYSGASTYLLEGVRDLLYYKTDKDKIVFAVSAVLYISISFLFVRSWVDYLPIFASLVDGYSLTLEKKYVTIGAIISYSAWVIYSIHVFSFAGLLIDAIILISNIFIYMNEQVLRKKGNNHRGIINLGK